MGICGLGLSWRVAAQVLGAPHAIGEALIALAAALFVVLGTIYVLKLFNAPDAVAAEFRNPTTSSQFGSLTIALLLLAVGILPYAPRSALAIWSAGAAGQCLLFLTLLDRWISEPTELGNATPSWLIPIVGNVTATFAGVPLGFPEISWFLFAVGLVFWLTFLPLLLNRLIFHHEPLPPQTRGEQYLCNLSLQKISKLFLTPGGWLIFTRHALRENGDSNPCSELFFRQGSGIFL